MSIDIDNHSGQWKEFFDKHGYISIPGFIDRNEILDINDKLHDFVQKSVPSLPNELVFYENKEDLSTLKQIQLLYEHDPFFSNLMFESPFERLARILLGEDVTGRNMQFFNKPPGISQVTPPHQDGFFFKLKPNSALTMWMALEDVDEENGCVRYIDRSHKWGMRAHSKSGILGFSQSISDFGIQNDIDNEIAFPCKAGHLIAHHSLTIHRADQNRSKVRSRRALGFIYYGASAKEDKAAHTAYQEELNWELLAHGKI